MKHIKKTRPVQEIKDGKVKFIVTIEAELDWNDAFAGTNEAGYGGAFDASRELDSTFFTTLQKYVADAVFTQVNYLGFNNIGVKVTELPKEALEIFNNLLAAQNEAKSKKALSEVERLKAEKEKLEAKLKALGA